MSVRKSAIPALLAGVLLAVGCSSAPKPRAVVGPSPSASPSASPSPSPAPSPSPVPPPSPSPTVKPTDALPPPLVNNTCHTYDGKAATEQQVKVSLGRAAGRQYWQQAHITIPVNLLKALAWQESGWNSNIVACDGGTGVMQLMPATVAMLNGRFVETYDVHTLDGNTSLGAEYVAWLTRYFGDNHFHGNYDLGNEELLEAVISAYNAGPAAVEGPTLKIPNRAYVDNVRALTATCECLTF